MSEIIEGGKNKQDPIFVFIWGEIMPSLLCFRKDLWDEKLGLRLKGERHLSGG